MRPFTLFSYNAFGSRFFDLLICVSIKVGVNGCNEENWSLSF